MKTKIGGNLVSNIEPRLKPYEICDTELRGFRVRVQPSGVISFICTYRTRLGRRHRVVLGRHPAMSPAQARDEARKVLGDVARGIDSAAERAAERQQDFDNVLMNGERDGQGRRPPSVAIDADSIQHFLRSTKYPERSALSVALGRRRAILL